jgi:hypothetical protein
MMGERQVRQEVPHPHSSEQMPSSCAARMIAWQASGRSVIGEVVRFPSVP